MNYNYHIQNTIFINGEEVHKVPPTTITNNSYDVNVFNKMDLKSGYPLMDIDDNKGKNTVQKKDWSQNTGIITLADNHHDDSIRKVPPRGECSKDGSVIYISDEDEKMSCINENESKKKLQLDWSQNDITHITIADNHGKNVLTRVQCPKNVSIICIDSDEDQKKPCINKNSKDEVQFDWSQNITTTADNHDEKVPSSSDIRLMRKCH